MRIPALPVLSLLLVAACGDVTRPAGPESADPSTVSAKLVTGAAGGPEHIEDTFFTVAMCAADIGFDIRFGGPRVMVRNVAGNDTTLAFLAKEFQG